MAGRVHSNGWRHHGAWPQLHELFEWGWLHTGRGSTTTGLLTASWLSCNSITKRLWLNICIWVKGVGYTEFTVSVALRDMCLCLSAEFNLLPGNLFIHKYWKSVFAFTCHSHCGVWHSMCMNLSVLQTFFLLHKSFKCITPEIARKPCSLDFDIHDKYDTAQNLRLSNTPLSFNNGCEEYLVCFFIRSHQKDKSKPQKKGVIHLSFYVNAFFMHKTYDLTW